MNYYLGVDGGGSKTLAVVADSTGRIRGRGTGGCGNHQLGAELAEQSIQQAVSDALAQAGLMHTDIAHASFGLAGADREPDFAILRPLVSALGLSRYHIVCDTVIAMRAGTRQRDGVVLICGSGTNCYGVNTAGRELQIGGFGYAFGDFGGGSELAIEVFRSVIRAWEGREEPTALTELTLAALGCGSVEEMFHRYLDEGKRVPHTLAKLLFQAGPEDAVARTILERQGLELGKAASAVIRRLGMERDTFDVVLAGSVLTRGAGAELIRRVHEEVKRAAPACRLQRLEMEPVAGAILLAMDDAGEMPGPEVYEQLQRELAVKERDIAWGID
ncbi:BadF/BadG/BcrA/BcrD ATPase family protein [Paenibacillus sp. JCM 10914]|uniref:N-acetylglucosamine kinase n=1 Tax=Paenibacillus sp. JCM 10914 TaxID=1236974 RepID=UPI0003CC46D9|nr:BadF/BadG/BcrA/BcrD ATPase family protein [Paenibacillus sp. JCM 10914]GAE05790.1 N-acetylglucosamine kinase of eukaryotic type [Paenibacillus sp. JCM 10914]